MTITLKEIAEQAIAKHSHRILKHEAGVLLDKDPEELHQMRVGMRRWRSAIARFSLAIDLPDVVTEKNISRIGHSLGKLRDLDVLLDVLSNNYRSQIPHKEQKSLDRVIKSLKKQRKHQLERVRKTLNNRLYLSFKHELSNWLEHPKYRILGNIAINYTLPDILLPQVSQFLLHPGWFVGVEVEEGKIEFPQILNMSAIKQLLRREDVFLHDLRKSAKKTRYSLELFTQFYGDTYHDYVKQVEQIQEILGQIQDVHVLRKVLEKKLRCEAMPLGLSPISQKMPQLASLLSQIRYQKWFEWQELQKYWLKEETRTEFRQIIQNGFGNATNSCTGEQPFASY